MSRDKIFLIVLGGLFAFMVLFGLAATILSIVNESSEQIALRVLGAIGSMFGAVTGLILGYLVGRNGRQNGA